MSALLWSEVCKAWDKGTAQTQHADRPVRSSLASVTQKRNQSQEGFTQLAVRARNSHHSYTAARAYTQTLSNSHRTAPAAGTAGTSQS